MIPASSDETWVFGVSIDEKIELCLCRAVPNVKKRWALLHDNAHRIRAEIAGDPAIHYSAGTLFDTLKQNITAFLNSDRANGRGDYVKAIGVSIVGISDRRKLTLQNVARTDWSKPASQPIVDFRALFSGMFKNIDVNTDAHGINIHNEATAKCLAEWDVQPNSDKADSLFYVMFSRGVNAAFVADGHPPYTELHTELGHMWPRPHSADMNDFNLEYSGCRIHKLCFEGLASSRRIDKQWGGGKHVELASLPIDNQLVISFYIAQMCLNGMLAVSPAKILLGGGTVFPALVPQVRQYCTLLNAYAPGADLSGPQEPYVDYPAAQEKDFIDMARIPYAEAGLAGALELAVRVLRHPAEVLWVGKKRALLSPVLLNESGRR